MDNETFERRQAARREYMRKQRRKRQIRNRAIIIGSGVLILVIIILIISGIAKGCSKSGDVTPTQPATSATAPASASAAEKPTEKPTKPASSVKEISDNGEDGKLVEGIYIWDNKGFELFFGGEDSAKTYAAKISEYKQLLGSGINVYNMVVPNHTEFGLPARLTNQLQSEGSTRSQRESTSYVYNNYSADIKAVDIYNVLNEHKTEYLYFNTDHHWTGLGAYYAYTEFAKVAGKEPFALQDAEKHTIEGFTGSLCTITGDEGLRSHPDHVDYYEFPGTYTCTIPQISDEPIDMYYSGAEGGSNTYGVFIWGDNPLTVIDNEDDESGDKLLIVKESYGNALSPYFAYNYDEVHIVDFRHFEGNIKQYCSENGIKNVLFVNGVMSANTPMQLASMDTLFE